MKSIQLVFLVVLFGLLPESIVQAHVGSGIAIGTYGNVYCVHTKKHQVLRVTPDGEVSVLATGVLDQGDKQVVNFQFPHHLAIDGEDNIYIAEYKDGDALEGSFYRPFGIAIGDDGTLYVMDRMPNDEWGFRLRKISNDGNISTVAVLPG